MLRLRRMPNDDQPTWIVSLHNTQTGQQVCFPRLDGLIDFLQSEFQCVPDDPAPDLPAEEDGQAISLAS
jgi:hypothetical protein